MLKISELFFSIQGEGPLTGYETTFVRFSGCNQACIWCDTSYHEEVNDVLTPQQLAEKIFKVDACQLVTLTGGEPLIQDHNELAELVELLHMKGKTVAIETNGTIETNINFDFVVTSPKLSSAGSDRRDIVVDSLFTEYGPTLSVKFVIGSNRDAKEAKKVLDDIFEVCHEYPMVIIQPLSGASLVTTMVYIYEEWDLSFKTMVKPRFMTQLHKTEGLK